MSRRTRDAYMITRFFSAAFALLITVICAFHPAFAASPSGEEETISAVKKAKPSVVSIITTFKSGKEGGGSGVILTKDGFILTNAHVVENAKTIQVGLVTGKKFSAVIVGCAKNKDLAVIKVKANGLPVPVFGNSSKLELGQTAIAIGNPLKFQWSISKGCISAMNRDIKTRGIMYRDLIQTDAAINPGSSGGALIDLKGRVIGINTLVYTGNNEYKNAQGLSFAIPINSALETSKFLRKGEVQASPKPWIGISAITVTRESAENYDLPVKNGIIVDGVVGYGPAKKAGIEKGCIITDFNGQRVYSVDDFKALLNGCVPGQSVELTVWKNSKRQRINVTIEHQTK